MAGLRHFLENLRIFQKFQHRIEAGDPKYGKAFYNLATIFSSRGPYFDAKKATFGFKKYLELEPVNSNREKIELWLSKYGTK